ncbi:MAG: hypothetical protein HDT15_11450 [Oscillibacter sp.]|nr:hypothetical protein [Oscillibacter sp.]
MSKRCPDCGFVNDDSRIYCGSCGELLDPNLRLLKKLNDETSKPRTPVKEAPPPPKPEKVSAPAPKYDDEPLEKLSKEKKSIVPWVILGVAAVAVVVAVVLILL